MGLLDDAIREHLELKRRHGADPTEVARQEREAFGSINRPAAEPAAEAEVPAADVPEVDVPTPGPAAPPPEPEAIPEPPVADAPLPPAEPEPEVAPAPQPDPQVAPEPAAEHTGAVRYEPEDDVEWSDPRPLSAPDPEPSAEGSDEEEDVLEETPDFLQETPEHDRLWFEQRPPRDFDF